MVYAEWMFIWLIEHMYICHYLSVTYFSGLLSCIFLSIVWLIRCIYDFVQMYYKAPDEEWILWINPHVYIATYISRIGIVQMNCTGRIMYCSFRGLQDITAQGEKVTCSSSPASSHQQLTYVHCTHCVMMWRQAVVLAEILTHAVTLLYESMLHAILL